MQTTNLYRCRLDRGLTQRNLAKLTGIPMVTIQKYEQRTRHIEKASIDTLLLLAEALCVPIYRLLEDRGMADRLKAVEKERGFLL